MLPASIYITEDFGASYFPDANGNFGMMSTAAPETHIQVEGDFRENPEIYFMSPNRQLQTPSFGAFRRNNFPHHPQMTQEEDPLEMQFIL